MKNKKALSFLGAGVLALAWSPLLLQQSPIGVHAASGTSNRIRFEAEDGDLENSVNSSINLGDPFVVDAPATGSIPTSNGQCVENWGYQGNTIAWGIVLNEATTGSGMSLWFAPCMYTETVLRDVVSVKVNGVEVPWNETTIPAMSGPDAYYSWVEVSADGIDFQEGNNTIRLTNLNGSPINVDALDIYVPNSTTATLNNSVIDSESGGGGGSDPSDPTTPTVDGMIVFEAEDGIIAGRITSDNPLDSFITTATATGATPTSGGKCVEYWGASNNTITWKIVSSGAATGIGLSLFACSVDRAIVMGSDLSLTVNGQEVLWNEAELPQFQGGNNWYTWQEVSADGITLDNGNNIFVLTNRTGLNVNIDCIRLYLNGNNVNLSLAGLSEPPTVSDITIQTDDIKTNSPVKFTFEYSDDATANADLTIAVKVYYDYGGANSKKVTCKLDEDGSYNFTPTSLGEYTIIVRITDEDDQESIRTSSVSVAKEGQASGGGSTLNIVNVKGQVTTIGTILCIVSGVIVAGLIVLVVIRRRRTALAVNNVADTVTEENKEEGGNE